MTRWTLQPETASQQDGRVFQRPLGALELGFHLDSLFARTADAFLDALVEILDGSRAEILQKDSIYEAWTSLKQKNPLLAAKTDRIHFILEETRLKSLVPDEITFLSMGSAEQVANFIEEAQNSPERLLSDELLARVFIVTRSDDDKYFHILVIIAHCITDAMSNATVIRDFLDFLSDPSSAVYKLEDRLALSLAAESLDPALKLPLPRQRWRRAIGHVISSQRQAKLLGGHTLPRRVSISTSSTPAKSCRTSFSFSPSESLEVIKGCRKHGLTFGNVYPVLGQLAMARVLCRHRIRGEIGDEEWDFRRKELMTTAGPVNLRPYLDKEWYEQGGDSIVSVQIGFFYYAMPLMPLGNIVAGDRLPSFDELLSLKRLVYRGFLLKKQANLHFKNPLFLEILAAGKPGRLQRLEGTLKAWQESRDKVVKDPTYLTPMEQSRNGLVVGIGGSSAGNLDGLAPLFYPLNKAEKRLHHHRTATSLHCRPAELYLGAATTRKQLHLSIFWDGNVYERDVILEWLNEVQSAIRHYIIGSPSVKL
ncbi:hypothetical protein C8J56DRAFT_830760 [Mycena floridula]|nr:hypothetical protein C8J56DRAFT_830760 [Mycena floridula]